MNTILHSACIDVGVITTSFPLSPDSASGIFVERLVASMPAHVRPTVLVPAADFDITQPRGKCYKLIAFSYGPKHLQRLAHSPGGIPEALNRRDASILLIPLFVVCMFIAAFRLARQVDVIHGNWSVPGIVGALAAKLCGRRSIVTLRGEDINRAKTSWLHRKLLWVCLRLNTKVVVVSEAGKQQLDTWFPKFASRTEFTPNGTERNTPSFKKASFHKPVRAVTVGSLIPRKGVNVILKAINQLPAHIDLTLRVVGSGAERGVLEAYAKEHGLNVEFLGAVHPDRIREHLAWADIFIFASFAEGRPNALMEAMAAGLPIITTEIPGTAEIVSENCGKLFAPGDSPTLSSAIAWMIENQEAALTKGSNAREFVNANIPSWPDAAAAYAKIYESVCNLGR